MRKVLLLAMVLGMSLSLFAQDERMIVSIGAFKNKSQGEDHVFQGLVTRINTGIVNTRKFNVVDNSRLQEAIDEQKKVEMGLSDVADAPAKGKIKTAGYVLYGDVLTLGVEANAGSSYGVSGESFSAMVELNLRFMDIETGLQVASKTVKAEARSSRTHGSSHASGGNQSSTTVQEAIEKAAKAVVDELMELAYPVRIIKVGRSNVFISLTKERAKTGALYQVFYEGEELLDPDTGLSLGGAEELVGELTIERASPKFSTAIPVLPLIVGELEVGMIIRPISKDELMARKTKKKKEAATRFKSRF